MLAGAFSTLALPVQAEEKDKTAGEKASDAWDTTKEKTKEAANAVSDTTKKAVHAVKEALTPDPDANKVNVTLTDDGVDLPKAVDSGKTAFVVKNSGKEKHNFAVKGHEVEEKLLFALDPDQTKVLHVELKPGKYKAMVLMTEKENKAIEVNLTVR